MEKFAQMATKIEEELANLQVKLQQGLAIAEHVSAIAAVAAEIRSLGKENTESEVQGTPIQVNQNA